MGEIEKDKFKTENIQQKQPIVEEQNDDDSQTIISHEQLNLQF